MSVEVIAQKRIKSPVRWAGGKGWLAARLAKEIEACNPSLYVEPFLGGGSVALAIPSYISKLLADTNLPLIDFWRCLQRAPVALLDDLMQCERQYGNELEGYMSARAALNNVIMVARPMFIRRAALFMFINARCFNGLWRTNKQGYFNVPFGKLESPSSIDLDEAKLLAALLAKAEFVCGGYDTVLDRVAHRLYGLGTAVYCDPPYHDMFADYTEDSFGESEHRQLASHLQYLVQRGAKIWTTNNDTPLIREIYSWAHIEESEEQHNVGATGDRRGKRACLLIRGG